MLNILLTGAPRSGKTTLIKQIVEDLDLSVIGFITNEILENGYRTGFDIKTFSGHREILASKKNKKSEYRVSSYGVHIENLDFIIDQIKRDMSKGGYQHIILDEIGKMELFSSKFKEFVLSALETKKVVGTIMLRDNYFTSRIKERADTRIFQLSKANRNSIKSQIKGVLKKNARRP